MNYLCSRITAENIIFKRSQSNISSLFLYKKIPCSILKSKLELSSVLLQKVQSVNYTQNKHLQQRISLVFFYKNKYC